MRHKLPIMIVLITTADAHIYLLITLVVWEWQSISQQEKGAHWKHTCMRPRSMCRATDQKTRSIIRIKTANSDSCLFLQLCCGDEQTTVSLKP